MNQRELTNQLLEDWLDKLDFLNNFNKSQIFNLANIYTDEDVEFLYDVNKCIVKGGNLATDPINEVSYNKEEDKHKLTIKGECIELTIDEIRTVISGLIDILDDILPLGTVVKLKDSFLDTLAKGKAFDKENAFMIITNRYVFNNNVKAYFQYSATVYPIGLLPDGRTIHFTTPLIDKVIHRGYSDEKDVAYNFLMKNELIIEKNMHSMSFSTEEEREMFNKIFTKEA